MQTERGKGEGIRGRLIMENQQHHQDAQREEEETKDRSRETK